MKITSQNFENDGLIPLQFTCDGENINPHLSFEDISQDAVSLALILSDPDAPSGNWIHWTIWNIDPSTNEIIQDYVPEDAVVGLNSADQNSYYGPCPPPGSAHHYIFRLFALDTKLDLEPGTESDELELEMEGHILSQATLTGLYQRK